MHLRERLRCRMAKGECSIPLAALCTDQLCCRPCMQTKASAECRIDGSCAPRVAQLPFLTMQPKICRQQDARELASSSNMQSRACHAGGKDCRS